MAAPPAQPAKRFLIDLPNAVRGASTGFSILLLGGFMAPLVNQISRPTGTVWITLVAVVAFIVAARQIGVAAVPELHGSFAATLSYVLVLPLIVIFEQGRNLAQISLTLATAIIVGAITGWVQDRRRAASSR